MRGANGRAAHQLAQDRRAFDLGGMAAQRMDAVVERAVGAARSLCRKGRCDERCLQKALGLEQAGQCAGGGELRAIEKGEPFLGAKRVER